MIGNYPSTLKSDHFSSLPLIDECDVLIFKLACVAAILITHAMRLLATNKAGCPELFGVDHLNIIPKQRISRGLKLSDMWTKQTPIGVFSIFSVF